VGRQDFLARRNVWRVLARLLVDRP
jgi:hypothetical protein